MKLLLERYHSFCIGGVIFLFIAACFPATARADSLSSYGDQSSYDAQAQRDAKEKSKYLATANKYSLNYLRQARDFRVRGRYELARQRYLQALSICADEKTVEIIKRELNGVELLLRTMR